MSSIARQAAYESGYRFLVTYQHLSNVNFRANVCLYKLRPTFHYFAHVVDQHRVTAINCRYQHAFQDKDFMGKLTRLAAKVHSGQIMARSIQRYLLFLALRFEALRRSDAVGDVAALAVP